MSYFTAIQQTVLADTNNSSVAVVGASPTQWSATATYAALDLVTWSGVTWKSKVGSNTGNVPVEGTNWTVYVTPTPWSSLTTYAANDLVSYGGVAWKSKLGSNVGNTPGDGTTYWGSYTTFQFIGKSISTLGVAGIQVSLKTDIACIVYVQQSPDGTNWDLSDSYVYNHVKGNFGVTVQAISSYVRVLVSNLTVGAPSYFRLQTALCPIVEAVPRSLSDEGTLSCSIYELADTDGHRADISPLNTLRVNTMFRLVGKAFATTTDPSYWGLINQGGSSAGSVVNALLTLTSGVDSGGYAQLNSNNTARFITGVPNSYRAGIRVTSAVVTNNTRRWGAFSTKYTFTCASSTVSVGDVYYSANYQYFTVLTAMSPGTSLVCWSNGNPGAITGTLTKATGAGGSSATIAYTAIALTSVYDGFYFELSPTGVLSVNYANATSITPISSGSFNGIVSSFNLDYNVHWYEIVYFIQEASFSVDGTIIHTFKPTASLMSSNFNLPVSATSLNAGTSSGVLEIWSAFIMRLGESESSTSWRNLHGDNSAGVQLKIGAGFLNKVLVNSTTNASTIAIYDGIGGSTAFRMLAVIFPANNIPPSQIDCCLNFYNGLYVVTSSTPSTQDFTVSWE